MKQKLMAFSPEAGYQGAFMEEQTSSLREPLPPPLPPSQTERSRRVGGITALLLLLLFAGFYRWVFETSLMKSAGGVVSLAFIFGVPFALGALSVALARWRGIDQWLLPAVVLPTVVLTIGVITCFLTKVEALICIIMAAPVLFVGAILGGLLAHALLPKNNKETRLYLPLILCLPMLLTGVENAFHWPTEIKAIQDSIVIHAPASTVWPLIASVSAIDPRQIPNKWIYRIGFPKPIAATLSREGIGGVRSATFERGVSFFETVTEWSPPHKLAFTIHADPDFIPHTAFDQHIIVGGRFYNVLDGLYEIEPLSSTECRLHLTSHHRLTTRFNQYAAWWSERIMDEIQGSILEVIRTRAECAFGAPAHPQERHPVERELPQESVTLPSTWAANQ